MNSSEPFDVSKERVYKMKFTIATESEVLKYFNIAKEWYESTNGTFSACQSVAKYAVIEYIANSE